ncbi:hypothetical protein KDX08_25285 [Burkholderia cenocepacia]|uniref:hypothetical protein n=1 Tax=Burkholderia cenocepacia TaxID=95486 RepID=UPI001B923CD8|nr:hypothetical protein [Burkholderia cenocepacia]MBR7995765.1 hypothetical protein [Burkholderia cenocepacia]
MLKQSALTITAVLLLGGCKFDLDTHAADRYQLLASNGVTLRLNTETGEVAKVTDAGITKLTEIPASLPPGWSVKETK